MMSLHQSMASGQSITSSESEHDDMEQLAIVSHPISTLSSMMWVSCMICFSLITPRESLFSNLAEV